MGVVFLLSCYCQVEQQGSDVPHKLPGRIAVTHPEQACALPPHMGSRQVPFAESSSRSRSLELCSGLPVETETQVRGMDTVPPYVVSDLKARWRWTSFHHTT